VTNSGIVGSKLSRGEKAAPSHGIDTPLGRTFKI